MTRKLFTLLCVAAAASAAGQTTKPTAEAAVATQQVQEKITVERILIDARVTNDSGDPILGLKPEDFRVKIDGKLARVESVDWIPESTVARELANIDAPPPAEVNTSMEQPAPRGRLLIFFFQTDFARVPSRTTGQMQIVSARDKWLEWLEDDDRVAVFSFDSHLKFFLDFTNDKEKIRNAMEQALYGPLGKHTDIDPPAR
jgi:hypothetical protein